MFSKKVISVMASETENPKPRTFQSEMTATKYKRFCYGRWTCDVLVSRNSATTQHPIWKLESRAYCVALFPWSYI